MTFVHILSIIIMDVRLTAFKRLLDIMDDLREKCPWDQKQTLESLRKLTIEETYELADGCNDPLDGADGCNDILLSSFVSLPISTSFPISTESW